ncbi:Peptidyl-prolyl cis-trans isomerase CWC27 like protein [Eufriesea mexicana]|nr:Peptidyl-prolyl cis-trans isomerase CWC27 like protein [Eufriesea mexicana]
MSGKNRPWERTECRRPASSSPILILREDRTCNTVENPTISYRNWWMKQFDSPRVGSRQYFIEINRHVQQEENIGFREYQHGAIRCQELYFIAIRIEAVMLIGKIEFHTRLRFCRRDLITVANAGKDDNGSQFFFTLNSTPDLQNKHTIFGKVTEETIYNMLKLEEALVDENDRPLYLPRFIKTIILSNPFSDIIPRIIVQESEEVKDNSKTKTIAVKDFNLLSFGEEAEEDEEESVILNKKFTGKGKSPHDHLTDPKLSSQPAVEPSGLANK